MSSNNEYPDIMNVREIIDRAFGDFEANMVNFKLIQTVLLLLARQLRLLERRVEVEFAAPFIHSSPSASVLAITEVKIHAMQKKGRKRKDEGDKGADGKPSGGKTKKKSKSSGTQPGSDKTSTDKTSSDKASSAKTSTAKTFSDKASTDKATSDKTASDKASSDKASPDRAYSTKTASDKASSAKTTSDKTSALSSSDRTSSGKTSSSKTTSSSKDRPSKFGELKEEPAEYDKRERGSQKQGPDRADGGGRKRTNPCPDTLDTIEEQRERELRIIHQRADSFEEAKKSPTPMASVSSVQPQYERLLVVQRVPSTEGRIDGHVPDQKRTPHISVVTQEQFQDLAQAVRQLQNKLLPVGTPEFLENAQLMEELRRGASLTDAMAALQLSARLEATEKAIEQMLAMITELAQQTPGVGMDNQTQTPGPGGGGIFGRGGSAAGGGGGPRGTLAPGGAGVPGGRGAPGSEGIPGRENVPGREGIPGGGGIPGGEGMFGGGGISGGGAVLGGGGMFGGQGVPGTDGVPGGGGIFGRGGFPGADNVPGGGGVSDGRGMAGGGVTGGAGIFGGGGSGGGGVSGREGVVGGSGTPGNIGAFEGGGASKAARDAESGEVAGGVGVGVGGGGGSRGSGGLGTRGGATGSPGNIEGHAGITITPYTPELLEESNDMNLPPQLDSSHTQDQRQYSFITKYITYDDLQFASKQLYNNMISTVTAIIARSTANADNAYKLCINLDTKIQGALNASNRMAVLEDLVKQYADRINSLDTGLSSQMTNYQDQLTQMQHDLEIGLDNMAEVLANAGGDTEAVAELNSHFSTLQMDFESMSSGQLELRESYRTIALDLEKLWKEIEMLRESKSDREEVADALRDKAGLGDLNGLVSLLQFDAVRGDFEKRIGHAYDKFNNQEIVWQKAIDDLLQEMNDKADIIQVETLKNEINKYLNKMKDRMQLIIEIVGEPKSAMLSKKLFRNTACLSCGCPAHMDTEEPGFVPALPKFFSTRQPGEGSEKESKSRGGGDYGICYTDFRIPHPRDPRSHVCQRFCGGSHTLITEGPTRAPLGIPINIPLRPVSTELGTDGKLYKVDDQTEKVPCIPCNKPSPPPPPPHSKKHQKKEPSVTPENNYDATPETYDVTPPPDTALTIQNINYSISVTPPIHENTNV